MFLSHQDKVNKRKGTGCFFDVKITLRKPKPIESSLQEEKEIGKNGTVAFSLF